MKTAKFAVIMYLGESDLSQDAKSSIAHSMYVFDNIEKSSIKIAEFNPTEIEKVNAIIAEYAKQAQDSIGATRIEVNNINALLKALGYKKFPESMYDLRMKIAEGISDLQKREAIMKGLNFIYNCRNNIYLTRHAKRIHLSDMVYRELHNAGAYYFSIE